MRCTGQAGERGVLLTPKSGLYSLKVGMSAIGTKPPSEIVFQL